MNAPFTPTGAVMVDPLIVMDTDSVLAGTMGGEPIVPESEMVGVPNGIDWDGVRLAKAMLPFVAVTNFVALAAAKFPIAGAVAVIVQAFVALTIVTLVPLKVQALAGPAPNETAAPAFELAVTTKLVPNAAEAGAVTVMV